MPEKAITTEQEKGEDQQMGMQRGERRGKLQHKKIKKDRSRLESEREREQEWQQMSEVMEGEDAGSRPRERCGRKEKNKDKKEWKNSSSEGRVLRRQMKHRKEGSIQGRRAMRLKSRKK